MAVAADAIAWTLSVHSGPLDGGAADTTTLMRISTCKASQTRSVVTKSERARPGCKPPTQSATATPGSRSGGKTCVRRAHQRSRTVCDDDLKDATCSDDTMNPRPPIPAPLTVPTYVALGRSDKPAMGYTWRIWCSRTSFYLKSRAPGLGHLKCSLHSPDPRHPSGGGFKMAMDPEDAFDRAIQGGQILAQRHGQWPFWFPGKQLNADSTLVMRMRWT